MLVTNIWQFLDIWKEASDTIIAFVTFVWGCHGNFLLCQLATRRLPLLRQKNSWQLLQPSRQTFNAVVDIFHLAAVYWLDPWKHRLRTTMMIMMYDIGMHWYLHPYLYESVETGTQRICWIQTKWTFGIGTLSSCSEALHSLKLTAKAPDAPWPPKWKAMIFQPSFFRCELADSFRDGNTTSSAWKCDTWPLGSFGRRFSWRNIISHGRPLRTALSKKLNQFSWSSWPCYIAYVWNVHRGWECCCCCCSLKVCG